MTVYIAGKITGDPNYKEKFAEKAKSLEAQGHTVLNPAILPGGMKPADYMKICFLIIDRADKVAFLPDYSDSPGAMLEVAYCEYTGKEVCYPTWGMEEIVEIGQQHASEDERYGRRLEKEMREDMEGFI